jgi:DNA-binding transcriptional ArsR family regulator
MGPDVDAASDAASDSVFRALADIGRRSLLDALRDRDGQTLGELCDVLPDMTRFGVMKHLRVLEDAHLVAVDKRGRSKFHYLNPVPIREIHDRWISRYAEPMVVGLLALRDAAESRPA